MSKVIGKKIRLLRHKLNKSQADIAKELEISIPAYSKIETGITDINISRLRQIADLFNVSSDSLILDESSDEKVGKVTSEMEQHIRDLNLDVIELQKKLIAAYDEVHELRKQMKSK